MTHLITLCNRWQLPPQFLQELLTVMGAAVPTVAPAPPVNGAISETATQSHRMLRAAKHGNVLWRNNSGALEDKSGRPVRFGLGNTSPQTNKIMKSSDLIGITSLVVTPEMVGWPVAIFTAEEIKRRGWKYTGDRPCICKPKQPLCDHCHQKAQFNFIKKVLSLGGIARFVVDPEVP